MHSKAASVCLTNPHGQVVTEEYIQLMCELDDLCEEFKYLGSYSEVV